MEEHNEGRNSDASMAKISGDKDEGAGNKTQMIKLDLRMIDFCVF